MQLDPTGNCCNCPNRTSPCDNCSNGNIGNIGACCNVTNFFCSSNISHDDCVNIGGIYLGNGSACSETDCTCCPELDHYTTITLSGQVLGCSSGTVNLPAQSWTRVTASAGCTMNPQEFDYTGSCFCGFNAYNCHPFTNVDYIAIDETGGCADPFSFGANYFLRATIDCSTGTVTFDGYALPSAPAPACNNAQIITPVGPYDFTNGPIDITVNADTGDTTIQFRFIFSLS